MQIDRLIGILTTLLQGGGATAPQLAEKFEVSRRTIGRDIDALCRAGIPIVTAQGRGGGIRIAEGYRLNAALLTRGELQAILAGAQGLDSVYGTADREALREKLGAGGLLQADDYVMIDLASFDQDTLRQKSTLLRAAIEENRIVAFDYLYAKGEMHRRVEPYLLVFHWASWYLYAFCLERQAFRLFKLNRMWRLEETQQRFCPRTLDREAIFFDDCAPAARVTLSALFAPELRYRLVEEYGPDCCAPWPDGRVHFIHAFSDWDEMRLWVQGFGDAVQVLKPAALADQICAQARRLLALYGQGGPEGPAGCEPSASASAAAENKAEENEAEENEAEPKQDLRGDGG